jgi:hypothetical protein
MNATVIIRRRDPALIAARAHHVLDAAARMHAQWPAEGRDAIGEAFVVLDAALEEYRATVDEDGDVELAAETAAWAMALLLLSISVFLGKAVADEMMRNAAEVAA